MVDGEIQDKEIRLTSEELMYQMVALLKVGQPDFVCLLIPRGGKHTLSPVMPKEKKKMNSDLIKPLVLLSAYRKRGK